MLTSQNIKDRIDVSRDENDSVPLLSVIIPCHNYADYVKQAIDSVLNQKEILAEVIVIDDGSKDCSWEVISSYQGRITAVKTENCGNINSCLLGLSQSKGIFIQFLDADDALAPDAYTHIKPHLLPKTSKVQFKLTPIDGHGNIVGSSFPNLEQPMSTEGLRATIARVGCYPTPPTSGNVYRRDVYMNLGDLSYDRGIDGVAYLLAPYVGDVVSIPKSLGYYRIHNRNLSSFATFDGAKAGFYARRFSKRLEHLNELLELKGLVQYQIKIREQYRYTAEFELMGLICENCRPTIPFLLNYVLLSIKEDGFSRSITFSFFALLLYLLPNKWARIALRYRFDQSKGRRMRALMRTLRSR